VTAISAGLISLIIAPGLTKTKAKWGGHRLGARWAEMESSIFLLSCRCFPTKGMLTKQLKRF
jgi:hypothetical protein